MRATPRLALIASLLTGFQVDCPAEPGRDARGRRGAVTADHMLAVEAGLQVLKDGGNAIDAAITMAGVISVVRPHANGVGGDMFLLYHEAATGRVHALNASGRSGSLATLERVREKAGHSGVFPERGSLSISVPGAVGGWAAALDRFGTRSLAQALAPAERLAHGFTVSPELAAEFAHEAGLLAPGSEAARIFLPGGKPPAAGSTLALPELAATLARIRAKGPAEIYGGETGRKIVEHLASVGGLLTLEDLRANRPDWVDPISTGYRGLTVYAMPPNTQGVFLLETLGLLRGFDLKAMGHNSPDYLHTLISAWKLGIADRNAHVADPASMRVTVRELLEPARLARLASGIDPTGRASTPGARVTSDQPNTVYLSAVDERGNAVSLIQSQFGFFGSGIVVPGTGVLLHNRGSSYSLDKDHPNVVAPRKRPYHTLCPALARRDGAPWLAFGTPGGDGQVHTLTQILNNVLIFGMEPQAAIDAPRMRRMPNGQIMVEDRVPAPARAALGARGYEVVTRAGRTTDFGGAQAILVGRGDAGCRAGADRRREAAALAY